MDGRYLLVKFYSWYIRGALIDGLFYQQPVNKNSFLGQLTNNLYQRLAQIQEDTNADPLVCSQDIYSEWVNKIEIKQLDEMTYIVSFGPPPPIKHMVRVVTTVEDGRLKIVSTELYEEPITT
jgi:hypothetical protein